MSEHVKARLYVMHNGRRLTLDSGELKTLPSLPKEQEDNIKDFARLLITRAIEKHKIILKYPREQAKLEVGNNSL